MGDASRNAAIWYAEDGFDPVAKGINGRRVAGQSFLNGFLRHGDVDEFVMLAQSEKAMPPLRDLAARLRPAVPLRFVQLIRPMGMAPVSTVYYPSPNYAVETWRRAPHGNAAWAICGLTHTISTTGVMQGMFDLRMAPVQPWDAVICTSNAVQASVRYQNDLIDAHIAAHFGSKPPPRPMFPVIPLGVHCADFAHDAAAGAGLRARLGAGPQDVVFTTIARLTPYEKFDPLPIYLALQAAQRQLPGQKLHVVFCGQFRDAYSRKVFTEGAARLMPDVGFLLLDGAKAEDRRAALSGADVFLFLIDNIQETFGLAPLEAMAAGLPLLVSDWDGMKDTVTPDVGFRVTSRTLGPEALATEALRYQGGSDSYPQYCAATSALTELDMPEMVARILQLARNPDLRRRMGAAGRARANALYDWRQVIPQMQDLWAEQDAMRRAGAAGAGRYARHALPVAPSPTAYFATYPSAQVDFGGERFVLADMTGRPSLIAVLKTRNYEGMQRMFEAPSRIAAVLMAVAKAGPAGADLGGIAQAATMQPAQVARVVIWLLKYGFILRG